MMAIEDIAERFAVWSEAIKKILKSISAAAVALITAIAALVMWWPFGESKEEIPPLLQNTGYSAQCSQLYSAIDITWSESQWTVWEKLKRDMDC